jgi:dTDP-4-dehydrorhamnose 3,5-epimerase
MIDGVQIIPLKMFPDERGAVLHMLKRTDPHFKEFGEIYFSTSFPGVVKGWHLHEKMTLNYACVVGNVKLVLYDDRPTSPTKGRIQEIFLGERHYVLVIVPPGIWNGYKNIDVKEAVIANCASIPHDPTEIRRAFPHGSPIPYDWTRKDG